MARGVRVSRNTLDGYIDNALALRGRVLARQRAARARAVCRNDGERVAVEAVLGVLGDLDGSLVERADLAEYLVKSYLRRHGLVRRGPARTMLRWRKALRCPDEPQSLRFPWFRDDPRLPKPKMLKRIQARVDAALAAAKGATGRDFDRALAYMRGPKPQLLPSAVAAHLRSVWPALKALDVDEAWDRYERRMLSNPSVEDRSDIHTEEHRDLVAYVALRLGVRQATLRRALRSPR